MAEYTVDVKAKLDVSQYKQDLQNAAGDKPITVKVIPSIEFNTNIDADNLKNLQQVLSNYFTHKDNLISVGFKLNEDTVIENISNITKNLKENKRNISVDIAFTEDKKTKFEQDISKIQENLEILKKQEKVNFKFGFDSEDKKTFNTDITNIKKQEDSISNVNIGLGFNQEQKERLGNEILATKAFLESFNADKINISIQDDQLAQLKNNIENYFQNNPIVLTISQDLNDIDLGSISNKVAELLELQSEVLEQQSEQQQEVIQETTNIQEEATNAQIQRINELVEQFKNEEITLETLKSSFEDIRSVAESFGLESIINALDESTQEVDKFIQETNEIKEASDSISFYQERLNYLWEHLEKGSLTSQQVREDLNELFDLAQREDIFNFDNLEETSSQGLESIQYKFERLYQWIEECDDEELKSQIEKFKALEVQYQQHLIEKRELRDKENKENEQHMHDAILIENKFRDDRIENEKSVYDEKIYNLLDLSDKVREKAQENVQVEEDTAQQTINAIKEITVEAQQQAIAEREIDDERLQKKQEIAEQSKQLEQEASEVTKSELQGTLETVRQTLQERTNITKQALEDTKNLNNTINSEIESSAKQDSDELQRIYSENIEHLNYLYQNNSINFEKYAHDVMSTVKDAFKDGIIPEETVTKAADSLEEMRKKVAEANEKALKQQQEENKKSIKEELEDTQDLYNKKLISAEEYVERMRNILPQAFDAGVSGAQKFQNSLDVVEQELQEANSFTSAFNETIKSFNTSSNSMFNSLMQYFGITRIIGAVQNSFQKMVQEVRDLDVELTEFSKVTDLSAEQTQKFIDKCYDLGDTVARTGTEVVQAATLFKKMGYTIDESMNFAQDALMWTNVADGMVTVENSTNMLISTMKAFEKQGLSSTHVIDALNEVSNNYSTSSSALSDNLSTVAATLAVSGTSFEQTVGLMTAGIEIMPDKASKVANGLKTISQRIRQIDGDTADKLDEFLGEQGMSRFDEVTGELKGTYQILEEISGIWDKLTVNQRQYIGEVMAGKNQITVLNALMMNFSTAINATETALNSAGSAARENERVLDSIQGHIQRFQSAFEELSYNLINSGVFKQVVDFGTNLIKILVEITSHTFGLIALIGSGVGITVLNTIQRFNAGFQQAQQQVLNFNNALMEAQQHGQNLDQTLRDIPTRGEYFRNLVGDVQLLTAEIGIGISLVTALYQHYQNLYQERKKEFQDNINDRNKEADLIKQLKNLEQEYLETDIKDTEKRNQLFQKIYDKKVEIANLDNDGLSRTELLNGAIGQQNQLYDNQLVKVAKTTLELERQKQILEEVNNGNLWDKFLGLFPNSPQNQENLNPFGDTYSNEFFGGKNYQGFIDTASISLQDKIDTLTSLQEHIKKSMDALDPGTEYYELYRRQYEFLGEKIEELKGKNEGILNSSKAIAQTVLGDLSTYTEEQLKAMGEVFDAYSNFGISGAEGLQSALENLIEVFGSDLEDNFLQEIQDNLSDPDVAQAASDLINLFLMLQEEAKKASSEIEHNFSYAMGEVLEIYTNTTTGLQAQYDTLAQAVDEFNESGVITKETLKSLTENDLLKYLEIVNGELVINTDAFYKASNAALSKASSDIDEKVNAEIAAMANDMLTQSLNNVATATTGASQGIDNAAGAASDSIPDFMNASSSAEIAALAIDYLKSEGKDVSLDTSGLEKFQQEAQKLIDSANELRNKLGGFTPSANRGSSSSRSRGSGSSSSRSSTSTADREAKKAQREAEQAAKDAQKAWKDSFEIEYKKLKTYLDAELITHEEYYDALEELNKHFFEGRAEFEKEYWKYQDEIIKGRKKYLEDELKDYFSKGEKILKHQLNVEYITEEEYYDALTLLYETYYTDKEKYEEEYWKLEEDIYKLRKKQIKELEDELSDLYKEIEDLHKNYIKSLEEDNKELETVIGYAVDVLDEEIEKLKAEKTALSEANEALEEQIKLQELEDALEKAKQKKIRVYRKGQGFVYEQDTKAVGEAQSAIDEYKKELAHKKQLSMIDEEIAKLEEYKKAWKDITESYKRSQNEMTAAGVLGENAREKILAREYNAVGLVGTQYESVRARMEAANNATIEDLEDYIGDEATAGTFSYEIKRIKDKINEIQNKTVTLQVNTSNSVSNIQNVIDSINSLKNKLEQGYSTNNLNNWLTSWKNTINAAYQYSQQYGITPSTGGSGSGSGSGGSGGIGDVSIGTSVPATNEIVNAIIADAENGQNSSNASYILEYLQQGFKVKGISSSGKAQIGPANTNNEDIWWVLDQVYFSNGSSGDSSGGDDSGSSSGGEYTEPVYGSNGQIIGYNHYSGDGTLLYYEAAHAKGTLGTTTKTFLVNEEGMEAMVTPEGTVISAPSTGYGVIKNEYTERLTDFAADPMNFLNKTFSGYTGTYQNNPSTNEVININGNLNLPNVTDGQSFVDSIRNVALQYTTRRR